MSTEDYSDIPCFENPNWKPEPEDKTAKKPVFEVSEKKPTPRHPVEEFNPDEIDPYFSYRSDSDEPNEWSPDH